MEILVQTLKITTTFQTVTISQFEIFNKVNDVDALKLFSYKPLDASKVNLFNEKADKTACGFKIL